MFLTYIIYQLNLQNYNLFPYYQRILTFNIVARYNMLYISSLNIYIIEEEKYKK